MGWRGSTAVPWDGEMSRMLRQMSRECAEPGGEDLGDEHQPAPLCPGFSALAGRPHKAEDREQPQVGGTLGPPQTDWDTASLTRTVGLKLPQRRGASSSSRESLHRHHVAAAGAVPRQPVCSDGAAQPQPPRLQEATILCAPRCDVQLGTGNRAAGQQLQPALWEPVPSMPRQDKAPWQTSPSLHLPPLWRALRGTSRSPGPMQGLQSKQEEERRNLEAALKMSDQLPVQLPL